MNKGLFSGARDDWATPQELFDSLDAEFHFTLDCCANKDNAKCEQFFDEAADGLAQSWAGNRVFMNPPYGRKIAKWLAKAHSEAANGALVVCLVPARTDTAWWHDYCMTGEIRFIRGRLRFGASTGNAPFPSAVVIFGQKPLDTATGERV